MREITHHMVSGSKADVEVFALDAPGSGGACHEYDIGTADRHIWLVTVKFQQGPITERGINGVTNESLLAIVIDRLESFQNGPYACDENQMALTHARESLAALKGRTLRRIARGVEGTSQK